MNKKATSASQRISGWFATTVVLVAVLPVNAINIPWSGTLGTDFATGGNWVGGEAPANDKNDTAVFAGVPTDNQPLLNGGRNLGGVDFQTSGWALNGNGTLNINSVKSMGVGTNRLMRLKTDADAMVIDVGVGNRLVSFNGIQFRQRVRKGGAGVWEIAGSSVTDNVLGGRDSVTVEQGTLLVNGAFSSGGSSNARAVTVNSGASLGGTGTLSFTPGGALTVNGVVRPGDPAANGGIGTLSVASTAMKGVTFGTNSRLVLELGVNGDALSVNGNLDLSVSETLELQVAGPLKASYTLVTYTGTRAGVFTTVSGVPDDYKLEYGPLEDGTVQLVGPQPTVFLAR